MLIIIGLTVTVIDVPQNAKPITVYAGDGNDRVDIDPLFPMAAEIFGGAGKDTLRGGAGDDTLIGGGASDSLDGRGGTNIQKQ